MQNIDEILPVILHSAILKRPPFFLFFQVETWFLVCDPILGSCLSVGKELGKNLFFPRNHKRGIYAPALRGISCVRARVE